MSEEQEILQSIDEQLQQIVIVSEAATCNHRCGAMRDMQPIASLRIPNKFYVLSDRKNCLEEIVGTSVSKHLEIANSIIDAGGVKIRSSASTVEERLKGESTRYSYIAMTILCINVSCR